MSIQSRSLFSQKEFIFIQGVHYYYDHGRSLCLFTLAIVFIERERAC